VSDFLHQIRQWSHHRQLLGHRSANAEEVLQQITGVYGTHPSGPLSLLARVQNFTPAAYHLLDAQKKAFRVPAMRESVYLLHAAQAATVFSATLPPANHVYWQKRYTQPGRHIPPELYEPMKQAILQTAITPMPPDYLKQTLQIPDAILKPLLNRLAFEGFLLRVGATGLRANNITYVSAAVWAGGQLVRVPEPQALAWLAAQYLSGFGPARVKDFQWWAGITAAKAKEAIAATPTVELGGGLLLPAALLPQFENFKATPEDCLDLLPQWDSYTMGYAPDGRQRFVNPDKQERLYGKLGATGGNAMETVLVNGLAHGVWKPAISGNKINLSVTLWEKPGAKLTHLLQGQFAQLANFLQLTPGTVEIETAK